MSFVTGIFPTSLYVVDGDDAYQFSETEFDTLINLEFEENKFPDKCVNTVSKKILDDNDELSKIKSWLELHVQKYATEVYNIDESINFKITTSWGNKASRGQYHHNHHHLNSVFSGVLTLTPLNSTMFLKDDPFPQLKIDFKENNIFNSSEVLFTFEDIGTLFLFPSHLCHMVAPYEGEGFRRSLAFNTWPNDCVLFKNKIEELSF